MSEAFLPKQDGLLALLVTLANKKAMEIGITLTVKGTTIAGILIGYEKYYDGLISFLKNAKITTSQPNDTGSIEEVLEAFREMKDRAKSEDVETIDRIMFVHLGNASIVNNESRYVFQRNYWRVKMDSIDSYMLGIQAQ